MRKPDPGTITQAVIASFAHTSDARLKQIMTSLVQHLHVFARDVALTAPGWFVVAMNDAKPAGTTGAAVFGQTCDRRGRRRGTVRCHRTEIPPA